MRAAVILAVSFLVLLIGGGARFAIGLTLKPMVDEFGWARGELGLAVGVYFVVSAGATYISGPTAEPAPPRPLFYTGGLPRAAGGGVSGPGSQRVDPLVFFWRVF